ncbi:hypothetical protein [Phormidium tenue]|uniref:hypothetical protein n=1 Tax=Phormidium tenue TaxID=126344 RepID=UPI001115185A|nr:hypothetical protein [Phormidium tenue]MBD2233647.1 hypothetical protein [Phormidium tenue FACHB-1052]
MRPTREGHHQHLLGRCPPPPPRSPATGPPRCRDRQAEVVQLSPARLPAAPPTSSAWARVRWCSTPSRSSAHRGGPPAPPEPPPPPGPAPAPRPRSSLSQRTGGSG